MTSLIETCKQHYNKLKTAHKSWQQLPGGGSAQKYSKTAHLEFLAGFSPVKQREIAGQTLSEIVMEGNMADLIPTITQKEEREIDKLFDGI